MGIFALNEVELGIAALGIRPQRVGELARTNRGEHRAHAMPHFRADDLYGGITSARDTTVVYRPRQDERHTIEVATAVWGMRTPPPSRSRLLTGCRVGRPAGRRFARLHCRQAIFRSRRRLVC